MADEETRSLWDHISGECFEGPWAGRRLDVWPVRMTTVAARLALDADAELLLSDHRSPRQWATGKLAARRIHGRGLLPSFFHRTMSSEIDPRLARLHQGLGIVDQDEGLFIPIETIPRGGAARLYWRGAELDIERDLADGVPFARWNATGEAPMQLLTRWYGFSFTYPGCAIYPGPGSTEFDAPTA